MEAHMESGDARTTQEASCNTQRSKTYMVSMGVFYAGKIGGAKDIKVDVSRM